MLMRKGRRGSDVIRRLAVNITLEDKVFEIRRTQAFSAVYLNSFVFWDVTQRRLVKHRRFATICRSQVFENKLKLHKK